MISRNNYEVWFLDFVEGNLSDEKIDVLYAFLTKNPDLQDEFDNLNLVFLESESLEFSNKEKLKRNIELEMIEGLSDFEMLAINKIEGNITKKEEKELKSLVHFSDKLRNEYKILEKTKLKADTSIIYQNKGNLKRKNSIVIPLRVKYASSIAAIGLLLLFVTRMVDTKNDINNNTTASAFEKSNIIQKPETDTNIIKKVSQPVLSNQKSIEVAVDNQNQVQKRSIVKKKSGSNDALATSNNHHKQVINNISSVDILFKQPERKKISLVKHNLPALAQIQKIENRNPIAKVRIFDSSTDILTPKQFIIKSVKSKLEIDDNNYDNLNAVEIVSATLEKTKIGKLDFKKSKDTGKKYLAINIGNFGIERSWNSN